MLKRLVAEAVGTMLLVATVVGSGIMGERLAGGNDALALLGNTIPTGAILVVLILIFGPVSGAHFNPAVSFAFLLRRQIDLKTACAYWPVQIIGGLLGTVIAHHMFELPLIEASTHARQGLSQWSAEIVATFGLVITIFGCIRHKPEAVPYAVGLFITAGYWFTASTSFANPAVTLARSLTDTFSGIAPADAPGFIIAQLIGATLATGFATWMFSDSPGPVTTNKTTND
ncbi:MAG: glycerol uptake facilitator-like aquaporin [Gammaproteobacteria bacterium]|jgi:glycerol uptake facilitator-like aquaporin